jgi:hypothetical protein
MHRPILVGLLLIGSLAPGCKEPASGDTETDAATTTSPSSTSITTVTPSTSEPTTTDATTSTTSTSTGPDLTSTGPDLTTEVDPSTTTTGGGNCMPLACEGTIYACGDCMDNDADGKYDSADPECVSPCDDKEDTFATGLPGDNMDPCNQDCFFDGNSGSGDDKCDWKLQCDPLGPGGVDCPYDPNAQNCPEMQTDECVMNCQIPNGCDCFGCCTVEVDGMQYNIFLGDADCSLDAIENCSSCTPNDDCDEECHPEECEVCFGQPLPPECEDPTCPEGIQPCTVDDMGGSNCPADQFCNTGCCAMIVPG